MYIHSISNRHLIQSFQQDYHLAIFTKEKKILFSYLRWNPSSEKKNLILTYGYVSPYSSSK